MRPDPRLVWLDGAFAPEAAANLPLLSRCLHDGSCAVDGVRAFVGPSGDAILFRLRDHVRRLIASARAILLEPPFTQDQIESACEQLVVEDDLGDAYLRLLIFAGEPIRAGTSSPPRRDALHDGVRCAAIALSPSEQPTALRVVVSALQQPSLAASMPRAKLAGSMALRSVARRQARLGGADDALLLDPDGSVCGGPDQNLFVVEGHRLVTPPAGAGVLPGITRDTIATLARESSWVVVEAPISREQLYAADEAFLTGTSAGVLPVVEVDHRPIAGAVCGELTRSLQSRYEEIARGVDRSHPEWLFVV